MPERKKRKWLAECIKSSPVNFDTDPTMFIEGQKYSVKKIDKTTTEVNGIFKNRHNAFLERTLEITPIQCKIYLEIKGVLIR